MNYVPITDFGRVIRVNVGETKNLWMKMNKLNVKVV